MTDAMLISRALTLATEAHTGQTRYNGDPYIVHPVRVSNGVRTLGPAAVAAALLHDVVEDTHVTLSGLKREGFSSTVVNAVDALTKRQGESYHQFIHRARRHSVARWIKMADIRDNMTDLTPCPRLDKYRSALHILAN